MDKAEIERIFLEFVESEKLQAELSFHMPKGYENAFGTFDNCTNFVYLNFELLRKSEVELLFNLFHELRHVMQFQKPELFSSTILKTLPYVIMWDGSCMKLVDGQWRQCKLSGSKQFFTQMYASLPYEKDANAFAYDETKKFVSKENFVELKQIYESTKPRMNIAQKEFRKLLSQIDAATKEKV